MREGDEIVARRFISLGADNGIGEGATGWVVRAGPPHTVSFPRDAMFDTSFVEIGGLTDSDIATAQSTQRRRDQPVVPRRWWSRRR